MDAPDRGFALLIVAITLAVLSLIFAASLGTARQHLAAVSSALGRVRLAAAADGAIVTVEHDLATAGAKPPAILSAPETITIGEVSVRVSARPEAAKLDLNAAPPGVLERYFALSGLDAHDAKTFTDAIVKRREDARKSVSTTRYEDRTAALFQTVSELSDLDGADLDLVDCVSPDLTVFTASPGVDAAHASRRVRTAFGLPPAEASTPAAGAPVTSGDAIVAGELFELTAHATEPSSGTTMSRQVVVRVTGNSRRPIWTLAEQAPAPDEQASGAACKRVAAHRGP